jgi:hypothetical protein
MNSNNNYYKIFSSLEEIDSDDCRRMMVDYDSFVEKIHQTVHIKTIVVHCRNAEKSYFRKDEINEKKSLIRALDILESYKISDDALVEEEELLNYVSETNRISEKISMRLTELCIAVKW